MDSKRIVLYLLLIVLFVALWDAWQKDYPPAVEPTRSAIQPTIMAPPPSTVESMKVEKPEETLPTAALNLISVKTDRFAVGISLENGNIVSAKLLKYPVAVNKPDEPVTILSPQSERFYIVQNGVGVVGQTSQKPMIFQSVKPVYQLENGEKELVVQLIGENGGGLKVIKTFIFQRNKYAIQTQTTVENISNENRQINFFHQIVRRNAPLEKTIRSFNGAAISSPETPYQKIPFQKMNEQPLDQQIQGGWVAMQQPYFLTAWIPSPQHLYRYFSHVAGDAPKEGKNNIFTIGFHGTLITLVPKSTYTEKATLYIGPEIARQLRPLAKGLDLTIDYGWLSVLAVPIFKIMEVINRIVKNWGWSIVIVTILIKLAFYKLSSMSYVSMAKMRELQPRMQALKERYGDDRQALSRATMDLYKTEKVNPMGGCLPMLIQIPFFIALYSVLTESVELRQAPFILWINDLSVRDPYLIFRLYLFYLFLFLFC